MTQILSIRIFLAKVILKIGQEMFIIHSVLKTNPCTYKVKVDTSDLTVKKILLL